MDVKIAPGKLQGRIAAIPSKSHAQRVLIAAALSDAPTIIHMGKVSKDIESMIGALTALGASFTMDGDKVIAHPVAFDSASPNRPVINCGESGTAARMLLPLAAALFQCAVLDGEGSLKTRPFRTLCDTMEQNGCSFDSKQLPIILHGGLKAGDYRISGGESSQYISALLCALPLLSGDSTITLTSPLQSSGYVDLTIQVLKTFGVQVVVSATGYSVKGNQPYRSPGQVVVEGDWSNAAFWFAAGLTVTGLDDHSFQKDKLFQSVRAQRDIDIAEIPDLAPILSVCCAARRGDTRITGIGRLRIKESDRVASITQMIRSLGADVTAGDHEMIIHGTACLRGGTVDGMNDHRIVMSATIASCFCQGDIIIKGAQAAEKSYIGFFEDFKQLGGNAIVL